MIKKAEIQRKINYIKSINKTTKHDLNKFFIRITTLAI
jgi:hypothetical protein